MDTATLPGLDHSNRPFTGQRSNFAKVNTVFRVLGPPPGSSPEISPCVQGPDMRDDGKCVTQNGRSVVKHPHESASQLHAALESKKAAGSHNVNSRGCLLCLTGSVQFSAVERTIVGDNHFREQMQFHEPGTVCNQLRGPAGVIREQVHHRTNLQVKSQLLLRHAQQ